MELLCITHKSSDCWWTGTPAIRVCFRACGQSESEAIQNLVDEIKSRFSEKRVSLYEVQVGWIDREWDRVFYYVRRMDDGKYWATAPALYYTSDGTGVGGTVEEAIQDLERKIKTNEDLLQSKIGIWKIGINEARGEV